MIETKGDLGRLDFITKNRIFVKVETVAYFSQEFKTDTEDDDNS